MSRKSMWIGAMAVLVITATMALTFAGGNSGGYVDIDRDPPGDEQCICPAIYEPVVCKAADGTHHEFSSLCVAHCSGYTKCARIDRPVSQ